MSLKTDYKDAVFTGNRLYEIGSSGGGKSTITDVTVYETAGDKFGAKDINDTNKAINRLNHSISVTFLSSGWSLSAPYTQTITAEEFVDTDKPIPIFVDDGTSETDSKNKSKAYGCVTYFESGNGTVTATCKYKKPTSNFTVEFKGV